MVLGAAEQRRAADRLPGPGVGLRRRRPGQSQPGRDLALGRLVTEPVPGTTGSRPPLTETGWLTNGAAVTEHLAGRGDEPSALPGSRRRRARAAGTRSSSTSSSGMTGTGNRTWSCPMLAAVWQLIRLGLLREQGAPVVAPEDWTGPWPDSWDELPAITRLNPQAAAFAAYTTLSALSPRFLPVELAVRTILGQFAGDESVLAEATGQGRARRRCGCPPNWSTGSGTSSSPRVKPTRPERPARARHRSIWRSGSAASHSCSNRLLQLIESGRPSAPAGSARWPAWCRRR